MTETRICSVCPERCSLALGETGKCLIRHSTTSGIELKGYGRISTMSVEPIEKKPIYHFKPNSRVLSICNWGCNLHCDFCANFTVSQIDKFEKSQYYSVEEVVSMAMEKKANGICMTYSEPMIAFEYLKDLSKETHKNGLYFSVKTNGCVSSDIWTDTLNFIDAINIDWKGSLTDYKEIVHTNEDSYNQIINNIKYALCFNRTHLEISVPIYPHTKTDDQWILELIDIVYSLNKNTPIHLLKIFPAYKTHSWIATTDHILFEIRKRMMKKLPFVYIQNVFSKEGSESRSTYDPETGKVVATREKLRTIIVENSKYFKN